jgi:predicted aconitase with swiveling domain
VNDRAGWTADARLRLGGAAARGRLLVLDEPLSLWGGLDPANGLVIEPHHPQYGQSLAGRLVAMPAGRGSSSSSSVLAEALRAGTGPRALLLRAPDGILLVGALVARELYSVDCPILALRPTDYRRLRSGDEVIIETGGRLRVRRLT